MVVGCGTRISSAARPYSGPLSKELKAAAEGDREQAQPDGLDKDVRDEVEYRLPAHPERTLIPPDDPVQQGLDVVPGNDHQVVDEDVRAKEDRSGPHNQAQRVQRRQVFVIDVAEESLLEAGRGQAKAFRRWPQTS